MIYVLRKLGELLLLVLGLARRVFRILALAGLAVLLGSAIYRAALTDNGHLGIPLGLLLGAALGPARLAGVDFRQWLRDPATPSEIRDDSAIGLTRGAYHLLAVGGFAAFVAYVVTRIIRGDGALAAADITAGTLCGVAIMQAATELIWRFGLVVKLPPPACCRESWFQREPPLLPPRPRRAEFRRLIVCCDGTWNWPESRRETNVIRLVRSILPQHPHGAQIVHYHEGVGTGNLLDRLVGGGSGVGLSASVKACYGFLADNYREGDEILLFGFSRGAYVARALGGFIGAVGLLRKWEMDRFADIWDWYWRDRHARNPDQLDDLAQFRIKDVPIDCIGVWDTVGALGIPGSRFCSNAYSFHETELGIKVRHAFQALAIDEQRGNFQAAVWVPFDPDRAKTQAAPVGGSVQQVLKQMWFPGVHSNIGGGYPEHGLSDSTFLWMLSQLDAHGLLDLDPQTVADLLDIDNETYPSGKLQDSRGLFWKLIGCPMPRPIRICSFTEQVHESAEARATAASVPSGDAYKRAGRRSWVAALRGHCEHGVSGITVCDSFETDTAKRPKRLRLPAPVLERTPLDFCTRILRQISPKG
jgi:hypothetical protein